MTCKSNINESRGRYEEKQGESILWKSVEAGLTGRGEFDIVQSLSRPVRRQRVDDPFTHIVTLPKVDSKIQISSNSSSGSSSKLRLPVGESGVRKGKGVGALTQKEIAKIGVTPIRGGPIPRYILLPPTPTHTSTSSNRWTRQHHHRYSNHVRIMRRAKDIPLDPVPRQSLFHDIDRSRITPRCGGLQSRLCQVKRMSYGFPRHSDHVSFMIIGPGQALRSSTSEQPQR